MSLPKRHHPIRDAAKWTAATLAWAAVLTVLGAAFFLIFAPTDPVIFVNTR